MVTVGIPNTNNVSRSSFVCVSFSKTMDHLFDWVSPNPCVLKGQGSSLWICPRLLARACRHVPCRSTKQTTVNEMRIQQFNNHHHDENDQDHQKKDNLSSLQVTTLLIINLTGGKSIPCKVTRLGN